jgi:hypothetical protein
MFPDLPKGSLILCDIDLTLTLDTAWNEMDCLTAKPNQPIIDWINKKYMDCSTIIIYSARREDLLEATKYWLKRNKVYYHALRLNKTPCTLMLDDKCFRPEEVLEQENSKFLTKFPSSTYIHGCEKSIQE